MVVGPMLGLLAFGAGVGLHIDQLGELTLEEGTRLSALLGGHLEPRAGGKAVLDDPLWPECTRGDRCLDDLRLRTQSSELVFLRIYGGPTKIRLIAERLEPSGRSTTAQRNLPRESSPWVEELGSLAIELYPTPLPKVVEEAAATEGPAGRSVVEPGGSFVPLIPVGAAIVLGGVGVGFGLSSQSSRSRIESVQLNNQDYESELNKMETHGLIANVLFGAAVTGLIAGVVLWAIE